MEAKSSHYTVLARRFRPQTFGDVVGQQHVSQALRNAIQSHRVAHAYLFTGTRGVGKTSMARILAKSLNCPRAEQGNPCNQCEICQSISSGSDFDVLEIDGASNRGIEDIRLLRSNVNVKPMRTRYKIYIIDEIHMLTKDAFNALLKTLEEPPPKVKFIFCTTEPNKVPDTILSRCQRFDFSTIETSSIVGRLQQIAEAEGIGVQPAVLELVARRGAGSMRDSQSLFDQLLAFGGERITPDEVHRLFGTASDERLIELVDSLIERRRDALLMQFDRALSEGVQLSELIEQLLNYLRDLMVLAAGAEGVSLLSVSQENRPELARQATKWGLETTLAALQILAETKNRMFRVTFDRALAEMGLIRIALLDDLEDLGRIIQQLKDGGGSIQPPPSKLPAQSRQPARDESSTSNLPPSQSVSSTEKKTENHDRHVDPEPDQNSAAAAPLVFRQGFEESLLSELLETVDDTLKPHLRVVSGLAISGPNLLDLTFPKSYSFSKQYCEQPETAGRLNQLVSQLTGQSIRVICRLAEQVSEDQMPPVASSGTNGGPLVESADDPFVQQVVSVFQAKVIRVEGASTASPKKE